MKPQYLGDSVYVNFDGYMIRLATNNGSEDTNTIYLEPAVYSALVDYVARLKEGQDHEK